MGDGEKRSPKRKRDKSHSRAREKEVSSSELTGREQTQIAHRARVGDIVRRMVSGEIVLSKDYAAETGCTIDEAKGAVQVAKAIRSFLADNPAYREKLDAYADAAMDASWGDPEASARLLKPISDLRGYTQSGAQFNLQLDTQINVALEDRRTRLSQELDSAIAAFSTQTITTLERLGDSAPSEVVVRELAGGVGQLVDGLRGLVDRVLGSGDKGGRG